MINVELQKLYDLHTQAEKLATVFYISAFDHEFAHCDRVRRFKLLAEKAGLRAERRYQAIKSAHFVVN